MVDFKFACSSYPAFDAAFMGKRAAGRCATTCAACGINACIAVWCGNNEISLMTKPEWSDKSMGKAVYDRLFSGLLGGEVKVWRRRRTTFGQPGGRRRSLLAGLARQANRLRITGTLNGFLSEFGFQSFPEPATVRAYTRAEDRDSVFSSSCSGSTLWRQRNQKCT